MENKEALSTGYDRSAPLYDLTVGPQFLRAFWNLLPCLRLGPGAAVLDIGCGTGINLLEAARTLGPCRKLVGIDLSSGMIEVARHKAELLGVRASFIVGDVEKLPLDENSFDLVICNSVYHWFSDRQKTLKRIARALRPGGQILLNGVAAPGFQEWNLFVNEVGARLFDKAPWFPELPTPTELLDNLRIAGFAVDHFRYEIEPTFARDMVEFVRTMATVAPSFFAGAPKGAEKNIVRIFADELAARFPQGFCCTSASIAAVARKLPPLPKAAMVSGAGGFMSAQGEKGISMSGK